MNDRSLDSFAERKLESLQRRSLKRELRVTRHSAPMRIVAEQGELLSFASNDYLGLAADPAMIAASVEATRRFGAGAGASRLITGNHELYAPLEQALAEIKGTEAAVVFGSGYLTNIGVIPVFAGAADLVLVDELAHSCVLAGARLSTAQVLSFAHNDVGAVRDLLEQHRVEHRHCLIVTDGVFSMDGDLAPLPELAELAAQHGAWLMTDDAHGLGVVGKGRGSSFAHDRKVDIPLQMGTLSKAVGAYGGYLCASAPVIELVHNRARSFVYSTGLPPGTVAAAHFGLRTIATDSDRVARPMHNAQLFTDSLGLPPPQSAIIALVLGDAEAALSASRALAERGFHVPAIRPPTVPPGTSRLRIAFSSAHSADDVAKLSAALQDLRLVE